MPITTVAVTCTAARPDGSLIAGGKFRFLLSNTDTENGLVVPREISATANAQGVAVANLWPNSLGALGTQYRVLLTDPLGSTIDLGSCTVPTSACNLHAILGLGTAPTLDQATVAKLAAQTAAAASSTSATQSASSATQAATSATAAAGSATGAAASQTAAAGLVTSAANSATAAGNSATSAASSNTAAGASATSAASSAADALSSKNAAATSATNSASNATAAQTSATNAATSATTATTKASEAATSASNAATSATAALASQNAAATSETNAQGSATTAATQAGNAATSATNAASSASAAASSAAAVAAVTTGNMSSQNANSVAITGGAINGTTVGATTVAAGSFTTLNSSENTRLGGLSGNQSLQVNNLASAVNYAQIVGAVATGAPILSMQGADTNIPFVILAKGSGDVNVGGTSTTTSLKISTVASQVNSFQIYGHATGNSPTLTAVGTDTNIGLSIAAKGTGTISQSSNGQQAFNVATVSGSDFTNYYNSTGNLNYTAAGGSTNINFAFASKGTGAFNFATGGGRQVQIASTASAVNYLGLTGAVTGAAPILSVAGSDANVSLALQSKGTGAIDLAAGSSGVNISNGGTVTAITRTSVGSGYTTNPTVVISAPTTAGGVQATASTNYNLFGVGVLSGGTGYTVSDVLTIVGGTFTDQLQFTVTAVSAGVITAVSVLTGSFGIYSSLPPSAPATVTGGTGAGATFNLSWSLRAITVATAGSGYVEQPTITFSGGGGTGAAAYATIGSSTAIKSLGTTISFNTPGGTQFMVGDSGGTATDYVFVTGSYFGRPAVVSRPITGANVNLAVSAFGLTGVLQFMSNNTASTQAQVTHTASAVNYLNLTGGATGAAPTISAQGSDASINLAFVTKGTGSHTFNTGGGQQFAVGSTANSVNYMLASGNSTNNYPFLTATGADANVGFVFNTKGTGAISFQTSFTPQVSIIHTASAVNLLNLTGATTGNAPNFYVTGSDANINLKLTPKGTGVLQFGTYTAGVVAQAGYITITDAGGTSRRLLVG